MRIYEFTYMNTYFYSVEYCIHHGVRLLLFYCDHFSRIVLCPGRALRIFHVEPIMIPVFIETLYVELPPGPQPGNTMHHRAKNAACR